MLKKNKKIRHEIKELNDKEIIKHSEEKCKNEDNNKRWNYLKDNEPNDIKKWLWKIINRSERINIL